MIVLFDFNGTLVDDDIPCWRAIEAIFHHYGVVPPTTEEYYTLMEVHWIEVFRAKGIDGNQEDFNAVYVPALKRIYHDIKAHKGIHAVLDSLKKRGYTLGIISAGSEHINRPVLETTGLAEYFDHDFIEFENRDKCEAIQRFVRKANARHEHAWYVGDAPSDIAAGHRAGVHSVAFMPGFVPENLLHSKKPTHAIRTMDELLTII